MPLLIYPGQCGEPVELQAILREAHEAQREARSVEIAARVKAGAPLDDDTRWADVSAAVHELHAGANARDTGRVSEAARQVSTLVDGHTLEPIEPYSPSPDLDGIVVTLRVVSDTVRRNGQARLLVAYQALVKANAAGDVLARREADERMAEVYADVVGLVVAEIRGLDGFKSLDESMEAIRLAGLLEPLYLACRYFLDLPVGKALRCGRLQPSI